MEKPKKTPQKVGFILRKLRKILLGMEVIDEQQYIKPYAQRMLRSFLFFIFDIIINGSLWYLALLWLDVLHVLPFRQFYLLIPSFGAMHFMVKEAFEQYRKSGG